MDLTADIVGRQDLTAQGPEPDRHYSWSFNVCDMLCVRRARDKLDNSSSVNLPDGAVLARYDHLVLKCALMVERKRTVVRPGTPDRRKQRDHTSREFIDVSALCDENVARSEPGIQGLSWSDSQVFFDAGTNGTRDLRQHRGIPHAVDRLEILVAEFGLEKIKRGSDHAYGPVETSGKETWIDHRRSGCFYGLGDSGKLPWIAGVKDSCER